MTPLRSQEKQAAPGLVGNAGRHVAPEVMDLTCDSKAAPAKRARQNAPKKRKTTQKNTLSNFFTKKQ